MEVAGIGRQSDANELEKVKDAGRELKKRRKTNLPLTTEFKKRQLDKDVAMKLPQTAILRKIRNVFQWAWQWFFHRQRKGGGVKA